jgi:hypothetical protein
MRLRGHLSFTTGILTAMSKLYHFRKNHAPIQEMSPKLVGLHNGVPYSEGWSRIFIAVIASSILFSVSQGIYANRQGSACQSERSGTGRFCSLASLVQLCYLVSYVVGAIFSRGELWECHFILSLALMHTVEMSGIVRAA